jgi:hypothetical protein
LFVLPRQKLFAHWYNGNYISVLLDDGCVSSGQVRRHIMAVEISKVDVWAGEIADRVGGLAEKFEAVAGAGANLEFVIARRSPEKPGTGIMFMAPIKGAKEATAAERAGLSKATNLHSLRLEAADKPGLGAKITRAVAEAGVSMRGLSAAAIGNRCVVYFAFDSEDDARKASDMLKKVLAAT